MQDKQPPKSSGTDALIVFFFFLGVALIAAGLRQISHAICLVFLGIIALYLACCAANAANTNERTDKK